MIPEKAKQELIQKREAGESWTSLGDWLEETHGLKVHRSTIQRWYDKEGYLGTNTEDNEKVRLDKLVNTYKSEIAFYKKLYEQSISDTAKEELLLDTIANLTPAFEEVKLVVSAKDRLAAQKEQTSKRGDTAQVVIAPLSDTHIGDYVDYEQMAGLNSYSIDIFNKRLYGWTNQVLDLVDFRRTWTDIDELVVPMLGDMISGDIHEELMKTNLDHCMGQMIRGANLIAQSLMTMAPHFEKVRVPCVVGNHGRTTRKPPSKEKYVNWDYMLYQWVAAFCRNQSNIEFQIPKSFMNVFQVCNRNILMLHGDSVSGGGTNISKLITSMRTMLQYRNGLEEEVVDWDSSDVNMTASHFDSIFIGHFHRVDELDIGTGEAHICGCMKGGDEYSFTKLHVMSKPKQIVTYWHPKYGYVGKEVIYLNRYDVSDQSFTDVLPDVWVS